MRAEDRRGVEAADGPIVALELYWVDQASRSACRSSPEKIAEPQVAVRDVGTPCQVGIGHGPSETVEEKKAPPGPRGVAATGGRIVEERGGSRAGAAQLILSDWPDQVHLVEGKP